MCIHERYESQFHRYHRQSTSPAIESRIGPRTLSALATAMNMDKMDSTGRMSTRRGANGLPIPPLIEPYY